MKLYKILVFESAHRVMQAEQLLLKEGLQFEIIPTPKEISSDCGLSIRFDPLMQGIPDFLQALEKSGLWFKIYEKQMQ